MIYWIVVIGGSAVAITGYILMFPFYGTGIAGMQLAQIIHGIVALLFVAAMLGHIYIGTIGMEGAFEAMGTGEVDVNWAKEHHSLWLEAGNERRSHTRRHAQGHACRIGLRSLNLEAPGGNTGRFAFGRESSDISGTCVSSASPAGAVPAKRRS